jgi:hypothetical protein
MKRPLILLLVSCLALGLSACEERTDRTDQGGVILSTTDFDGLPVIVSANTEADTDALVSIDNLTITSFLRDPDGTGSDLMSVELQSYQVIYTRIDGGTVRPPPYIRGIFGILPAPGTTDYTDLPIMGAEQIFNPPISNLLFENGGVDPETGTTVITLNAELTFFGETLSGDDVATQPVNWSIEVRR